MLFSSRSQATTPPCLQANHKGEVSAQCEWRSAISAVGENSLYTQGLQYLANILEQEPRLNLWESTQFISPELRGRQHTAG